MNQNSKKTETIVIEDGEHLLETAFYLQEEIEREKAHLEQLESRLAKIKRELVDNNIREAGNYELFEKLRTVRAVNITRFKELYPETYERIKEQEIERAKINAGKSILVKDVEYLLGKSNIDPVCDIKVHATTVVLKKRIE